MFHNIKCDIILLIDWYIRKFPTPKLFKFLYILKTNNSYLTEESLWGMSIFLFDRPSLKTNNKMFMNMRWVLYTNAFPLIENHITFCQKVQILVWFAYTYIGTICYSKVKWTVSVVICRLHNVRSNQRH